MLNANDTSPVLLAREKKAHTLQHKIVIFLIVLVLFIAWPTLKWAYDWYKTSQADYEKASTDLVTKQAKQKEILADVQLLADNTTPAKKAVLVQCFNTDCQNLPQEMRDDPQKSIFKTYLQLQQASEGKFSVDQKKVLAYLNEFLVKGANWGVNWQIQAITFWEPEKTDMQHLVAIPMNVTMSFANKDWLLWFLRNIESLISPSFPMLATVETVTYDVVWSNQVQDVEIAMILYFIQQQETK